MEGTTCYYQSQSDERVHQVAFFEQRTAVHRQVEVADKMRALTTVFDHLGRRIESYLFTKAHKYIVQYNTPGEVFEQGGYRLYAASWLDKEILGYTCQAFFVRELTAFSPTYVYWVTRHDDFPFSHPQNLRYPRLPGFVLGYSWSAKRTFELTRVEQQVDRFLFSDSEAEPLPQKLAFLHKQVNNIVMPWFGNRIVKTVSNLVRLFGG